MTKLEAIAFFMDMDECTYGGSEPIQMAIEALKQDSILYKIRAEIMDFEEELFHRPNTDYTDYAAVRHCVEIIDKYKAGE